MQLNRLVTLTFPLIALLAMTACSSGGATGSKNQTHPGKAGDNPVVGQGGGAANVSGANTGNGTVAQISKTPFNVAVSKGFQPTAVQIIDTKQAYVAAGNMLYETINAGSSWSTVWSGNAQILKLDFENRVDGFVLVDNGSTKAGQVTDLQLWHTTNGGSSWTRLASQAHMGLSSVSSRARFQVTFRSREVGLIMITPPPGSSQSVIVLMTTDGGTQWTRTHLPKHTAAAHFADSSTGYALVHTGRNYSIEKTTNGGHTWTVLNSLQITRVMDARVQTYGANTVWITAIRGQAMNQASYVLYRSRDGGSHWQKMIDQNNAAKSGSASNTSSQPLSTQGPGTIPVMLDPVRPDTAFLLGASPARGLGESQIAKIGASQVSVLPHYFPGTKGWVLFLNDAQGWVVTTAADKPTRVYVTKDGGVSWQLKSRFVPAGMSTPGQRG